MAPWANYQVISVDHNDYSVVYSCTYNLAGALNIEYMWILSRQPYLIGSADSNAFKKKIWKKVSALLPEFDVNSLNLSKHTAEVGCKYTPLPPGMDYPNPNDHSVTLPEGTVDKLPKKNIPRPEF